MEVILPDDFPMTSDEATDQRRKSSRTNHMLGAASSQVIYFRSSNAAPSYGWFNLFGFCVTSCQAEAPFNCIGENIDRNALIYQ